MRAFPHVTASLAALLVLGTAAPTHAGVNWSIGIGLGYPGCYRPWPCYHPGPYYWPRPVYVVPPPAVYLAPAPVVAPVYSPPPPPPAAGSEPPPPPAPALPAPRRLDDNQFHNIGHYVSHLSDADERVRLESVTQLGRSKSPRAVDPLAATLSGDPSPQVREAAAKALGLIGSPSAMPALNRAAKMDSSHDVRRTAQFAIEIIQAK